MRKSEALVFRVARLKDLIQDIPDDIQFKVVARFLGRSDDLLTEEQALYNVFDVIEQELKQAQQESLSF